MSGLNVFNVLFRLLWRTVVIYLCALAVFISCYITFLQQDVGLSVGVVLVIFLLLSVLAFYAWTQNNMRVARRKVAGLLKEEPLSGLIQYGFQQKEDALVHTIRGMEVSVMAFPGNKKNDASLTIVFTAHAPLTAEDVFSYSDMEFMVNRVESHDEIFTMIRDYQLNYNAQQLIDLCSETVGFLKRQGYTPTEAAMQSNN